MDQYVSTGTIPQAVRDLVANKCQLLDEYILMQTGETEYTALIRNLVTKEVTQWRFTRANNYGNYTVSKTAGTWAYTVINEYYCYSNIGYGAALDLPVVDGIQAHASAVLVSVLMLAIMFKGVLFPCLGRSKRRR